MIVRYRFPAWAREHVGSTRPCAVKRWFDARGFEMTAEFWRKLLRPKPPASIVLGTWGEICDRAGVELGHFFTTEPSEPKPSPVRRHPAPRRKAATAPQRPQPPRPADYFGARRV